MPTDGPTLHATKNTLTYSEIDKRCRIIPLFKALSAALIFTQVKEKKEKRKKKDKKNIKNEKKSKKR